MANNPRWYDASVQAGVNAVTALLNNGFIGVYTGSRPALDGALTGALLAKMQFGATAFGASSASGGTVTATANAITSATAGNTGIAGYMALLKSDSTTVVGTGTAGTAATNLIMSSTAVISGANVSCSSFTLTESQTTGGDNGTFYDSTVTAGLNAVTALLNSGFIKIYTGAQPALNGAVTGTLLVTLTFGATAFGASVATGGIVTATANAITSGVAGNTGTAGYFALVKSDNTTVVTTGSVGTSNADLILSSLSITSGNTIPCAAFTISELQT